APELASVASVVVGTPALAQSETEAAREDYRAAVAALVAASARLRDAYGAASRSFFRGEPGRFPAKEWAAWLRERRPELLGGADEAAVERARAWLRDARFVDRNGQLRRDAWDELLGSLRPEIAGIASAVDRRCAGAVAPRFPGCHVDLGQAVAALDRLATEMTAELAHGERARDAEMTGESRTAAYGQVQQLARAILERVR